MVYSATTTYDWRGNKVTETDQVGHTTRYGYDLAGQLISTTTGLTSTGAATLDSATTVYDFWQPD